MVNVSRYVILSEFSLDSRLFADTKPICVLETSELLLMNDARWPWLIVVPSVTCAVEWHEMENSSRQLIDQDVMRVAKALKNITNCEKINIASLGNIVRQLHIHIVARNCGDSNWPNPVWGFEERIPYEEKADQVLIEKIKINLEVNSA